MESLIMVVAMVVMLWLTWRMIRSVIDFLRDLLRRR
jgi:hypothetical protein